MAAQESRRPAISSLLHAALTECVVQEHVCAADAAAAERGVQDAACTLAQRAHRHAAEDGWAAATPRTQCCMGLTLRAHPRRH